MSTDICFQTFKNFLKKENLENQKILLMVSGGVDSMVLLDVARKIIPNDLIIVFHLNHNTRIESKSDEIFVQKICSKLKINFHSESLTKTPLKNQEASWRKVRQKKSEAIALQTDAQRIITAHHASDLVETMLFRLTKGCGPSGLSPFENSNKPFWNIPKQALLDYAEENRVQWKEDSSNQDTTHQRNLIRQVVVPALRKITPNLESVFVKESQTFSEVQNFIESELEIRCASSLSEKSIKLEAFLALPTILQKELLRNVAQKNISQAELKDCLKWILNGPSGNSQKTLGQRLLHLKAGLLQWK